MKLEYNVSDLIDIADNSVSYWVKKYNEAVIDDENEKKRINGEVSRLIDSCSLWQFLFWNQRKFYNKALYNLGHYRWYGSLKEFKIYEFNEKASDIESRLNNWKIRHEMLILTITPTVWLDEDEINPYANMKTLL